MPDSVPASWARRLLSTARALPVVVAGAVLVVVAGVSVGVASGAAAASPYRCAGPSLPGGTYASVTIAGACQVNDGAVVVTGDVTVQPNGALIAAFARNDHTGSGTSNLTIDGSLFVGRGGTAILGCEPGFFTCADDPNQGKPTLTSRDAIGGDLLATSALGVLMHVTTVSGDIRELGGGGGVNCTPAGVFQVFGSPVYSDFEDNTVGGNVWVSGLRSCWFGALRDQIGGSVMVTDDVMADPDSMEVLADHIAGNLICARNMPANQYGDSQSSPSVVAGSAIGQCSFARLTPNPSPSGPPSHLAVPAPGSRGYTLGGADGGVFNFGTNFYGSVPGTAEILPYVGIASAPGGRGYWVAGGTGRVVGFGPNAHTFGDAAALVLNTPIVGIAAAPAGDGYWLASGDGGVFAYGPGARYFGSAGGAPLNRPVVAIASAPAGDGYLLAGSDGGVFAYGRGARYHGSAAGLTLRGPIVGIAVDTATGGYWLVGSDGVVFAYGAPFFGSAGGSPLNEAIVGIAAAPGGNGYYLVGRDGGVFTYGPGARFQGSAANLARNQPVDGLAVG